MIDNSYIERMAVDLAKMIDEEIINQTIRKDVMLKGWTCAPFTTDRFVFPFEFRLDEVTAWLHTNTTGEYRVFGKEFWFKSKKDLTAFILKFG
jgi:hypothetical protein